MPFVSVKAAATVSSEKMNTLQQEIGRIIALIPGKTIDNCMTNIQGEAAMFMSGTPAKAVFCEVRMYGEAPKEAKAQVTSELQALFTKELAAEKVYINFMESREWGSNGRYMG